MSDNPLPFAIVWPPVGVNYSYRVLKSGVISWKAAWKVVLPSGTTCTHSHKGRASVEIEAERDAHAWLVRVRDTYYKDVDLGPGPG